MKYIKYFFFFLAVTSLSACFPDNEKLFDGPTVTEFKPIAKTVKLTAAAGSADALIQLVGPHQSAEVTIPFVVDASSTAVAGVHYNIAATGSVVKLAANSSTTTIPISLIPGSVTATAGVRLVIDIAGGSAGILPNPNFKRYTLTIVP
jgi:hypothetical protein